MSHRRPCGLRCWKRLRDHRRFQVGGRNEPQGRRPPGERFLTWPSDVCPSDPGEGLSCGSVRRGLGRARAVAGDRRSESESENVRRRCGRALRHDGHGAGQRSDCRRGCIGCSRCCYLRDCDLCDWSFGCNPAVGKARCGGRGNGDVERFRARRCGARVVRRSRGQRGSQRRCHRFFAGSGSRWQDCGETYRGSRLRCSRRILTQSIRVGAVSVRACGLRRRRARGRLLRDGVQGRGGLNRHGQEWIETRCRRDWSAILLRVFCAERVSRGRFAGRFLRNLHRCRRQRGDGFMRRRRRKLCSVYAGEATRGPRG